MKVLVTGGAGYVGSALVPALLAEGYQVVVYDTMFFGNHTKPHPNLQTVRGDIRDADRFYSAVVGCHAVIHLACISNDPSFELDEALSRTINFEAFEPLVEAAKGAGVRRFIYASTSSVYGVSEASEVTEDHPLVPLTLYNTYKGKCEPLLFKHQGPNFECVTLRPSTVCGYAPRLRLDLAVNILTNLAYHNGVITVYGGEQTRPNIHIDDMVDVYLLLLEALAQDIQGQTFNVGARNASIMSLAHIVKDVMIARYAERGHAVKIKKEPIHDERSYQVSSKKIYDVLGYRPQRSVAEAVHSLLDAFDEHKVLNPLEDPIYYNVKQMRIIHDDVYKGAPPPVFDPAKGHLSEIDVTHRGVGS